jgi:exopolysaccharide production protein ExoY
MLKAEAYMESGQKRATDLGGALTMVVGLALPTLIAAGAIRTIDQQPPIFSNERIGKGMKPFGLLKLATMVPDAHLHEQQWQHDETDPRITQLGKILRRMDLNEAPQVVNILRGELHLIGARPVNSHVLNRLQDAESVLFSDWQATYAQFTPGIFGPGQLAERNWVRQGDLLEASRQRMREDMRYLTETASVTTDLQMIARLPLELVAAQSLGSPQGEAYEK